MMKKQAQIQLLPLDISPQQYSQKITKQLGNHFIYSKMNQNDKWNDKRLKVLSQKYFHNKTILDIGCNEGILSIPIAIKYQPKLINAIDIDKQMIKKMKSNIQRFVNQNQCYKYPRQIIQQIQSLPLLLQQKIYKKFNKSSDIIKQIQISNQYQFRSQNSNIDKNNLFPSNINCYTQNILASQQIQKYDCILCMNITKWIHLTYGDEGIKKLFANIDSLTNQGSILILESQPYSSYRKKQNLYASYKYNYKTMIYKPERFKDYLEKLGFQLIQNIIPNSQNLLKHQILIFIKKTSK